MKHPVIILCGLVATCGLLACNGGPIKVAVQGPDVICAWGEQKFDLCKYSSHEQMVEALLAEMTLDEKIGQMTQSVWHNNVSPEIIRKYGIGSIIHTEGPVPGDSVSDWVARFDEFQRQAIQTRLGIPLLIGVDAACISGHTGFRVSSGFINSKHLQCF